MSDDFGATFVTVTDEDGEEITLEYVDSLEYNGVTYMAFFPAEVEGEDAPEDEFGLVMLETVYDLFMEQLQESFEDD